MKLNDTIQSYMKKEIEKLGKSINKKLDTEIREIAQLIKGIQKKLNRTLKDLQASSLLPSCAAILQRNPFSVSGYYFIYSSSHKASLRVYCDMSKTCGDSDTKGWMGVVKINMSEPSSQCSPGLCLKMANLRTCVVCGSINACSLDAFPVGGQVFQRLW